MEAEAITWLTVPVMLATPEPDRAKPQEAELSRQMVPVALGRVSTWVPPVAAPVNSKLLVVEPPRKRLLNGAVAEPRLIVVLPGSKLVLMATPDRLDSAVLAPPPPPPKQLPIVVQTVPVLAGNVIVWLPLKLAKASVVVLSPVPATIVDEADPCRAKIAPLLPTVIVEPPLFMALTVVSEVMSELAPLAAAPRLVRAPAAVIAPVPPLATLRAVPRVKPPKVGVELVAIL